jgi:taurine dioxygenase
MTITVTPVSDALGAEITGVDLSTPLDPTDEADIRQAFLDHQLLIFPGQDLSDDDHVRLCELFGPVQPERMNPDLAEKAQPGIHYVSNTRPDAILPHGDIVFHMDQVQYETPCLAMSLYGMEVPSQGGETLFSNARAAYDSLPDDTKARLDGLRCFNCYLYDSPNVLRRVTEREENAPRAVHPVVRTHPETGRKAIHVSRLSTDYIVDMERDESDALLEQLFETLEQDRFVHMHKWRVGDLAIWDNRCVMHARNDYDSEGERRLLRRIAVMGDRPY